MSINWHWSDKIGEAVFWRVEEKDSYKLNIYSGNCLAIFLYEEDRKDGRFYTLASFWADENHMKSCLGLKKDEDNIFNKPYERLSSITFFKNKCNKSDLSKMVSALSRADFQNLLIIIREEELPFED